MDLNVDYAKYSTTKTLPEINIGIKEWRRKNSVL